MLLVTGFIVIMRDPVGGSVFLLTAVGAIGGVGLLALIRRLNRAPDDSVSDVFLRDGLSTDVINMSRIRIAGAGGLGLVAAAASVAYTIPFVGVSVALALAGGILLSFGLATYRRHHAGRWP
ncbi:MAG: hypothetical protein ACM4AI_00985 [Acidobacteriota bacterium]